MGRKRIFSDIPYCLHILFYIYIINLFIHHQIFSSSALAGLPTPIFGYMRREVDASIAARRELLNSEARSIMVRSLKSCNHPRAIKSNYLEAFLDRRP